MVGISNSNHVISGVHNFGNDSKTNKCNKGPALKLILPQKAFLGVSPTINTEHTLRNYINLFYNYTSLDILNELRALPKTVKTSKEPWSI